MIKPESNAPASMQPWVRTTNNQIEQLETAIAKINSVVNTGSPSIDHEQNQSLSNTFSFTPLDDGSTVTNAQGMNFTGPITAETDFSVAGSLVVGDPSRQEYNPVTQEAIGSIPNLKILSGQFEINPVTETEYYTTGQFNITDTTMNVDAYGLIHGDGLQITLVNDGEVERQNIEILDVAGSGTEATFEITNNTSNVAVYTAGKYVNISGVDPAGYNGTNLLITSVNTGVSPMTFTVASEETATYTGGGYVTINQPNSIYEGKVTVQGPSPDYTGVTVNQNGVHIGVDGGDPAVSNVRLDSTGLTAPSAFIDEAVINGTRLFISDTPPTAVNDGDIWIDKVGIFTGSSGGSGTVTSVGMTVPTGLTVSPSSITTSGTFAIGLASGYSIPTTTSQTNWDTSYTDRLKWDGGSTGLVAATGRTSLGATTAGSSFFTLANPSAITFPRINADNTVSALDAASFRTAIGAGTGGLGYVGSFQTTSTASSLAILLAPTDVTTTPANSTTIRGGATTDTLGTGGALNLTGGSATIGTSDAFGGSVNISGGASNTTNGTGGSVFINGGQGDSANGNGSVNIGNANTTSVTITPALKVSGGISGTLSLTAPTSTVSSLILPTGTQPTLSSQAFGQISAGAESVGIATTKTTGAGPGFGIIKAPQMVFSLADAPVAANSTTGVAAFAAANDTLSSLEPAKLYRFRGKYYVTYVAGGSAAALQMLFAFANAPQAIKYNFRTTRSSSTTSLDQHGIGAVTTGVTVSASNQVSGTITVEFDGYFTSNATTGGTLIPQIAASGTTSGGTFTATTGSWFEVQKMGTSTQTLISGNWG